MKAVHYLLHKRQRKPKGQSRMESPGSPVTLGTQDTDEDKQSRKLKRLTTRTHGQIHSRRVHNEGYSRNASCTLNLLIATGLWFSRGVHTPIKLIATI